MAKTDNLTDFLTGVADAIRAKKGTSDLINPQNFDSEIAGISSSGLSINGVVRSYKIDTGATINAGDFVEFITRYGTDNFTDTGITNTIAIALNENTVFIAYVDTADSLNYLYGRILTINGNSASISNPIVIESNASASVSAVLLEENKLLIGYGINGYGYLRILTINGLDIGIGEYSSFATGSIAYLDIVKLTANKIVLLYVWNSRHSAQVVTINNSAISIATRVALSNNQSYHYYQICGCALSENKILITRHQYGSSHNTFLYILTISGESITASAGTRISSINTAAKISILKLNENQAILFSCFDSSYSTYDDGCVFYLINFDGNTFSIVTTTTISTNTNVPNTRATVINGNKILIAYSTVAQIIDIEGSTLTAGTAVAIDTATAGNNFLVSFSESSALIIYSKGKGIFKGLTISGSTVTINEIDAGTNGTFIRPATTRLHNVGVAKTSGVENETIEVYCAT